MYPLKSARALPLLRGFMVFVTFRPWTFRAPLFRIGHFLLRKQKCSLFRCSENGLDRLKIPAKSRSAKKSVRMKFIEHH
jgi:hypothetical protein